MNCDNTELVEVSIPFLPIKKDMLRDIIERHNSLPISKLKVSKYIGDTIGKTIEEKDLLTVILKVPKEIKEGLTDGTLIRKGGIIVTSDKHQVRKWLVEQKSVSKAGSIVFNAIGIAESLLLDNKLKEIQQSLEKVLAYQQARYESLLPNAIDFLKKAAGTNSDENRNEYMNKAIDYLVNARNESQKLIDSLIQKNHCELIESRKFLAWNNNNYKQMSHNVNEIIALSRHIAVCYELEISAHVKAGESRIGDESRVELINFISDVGEYVQFFSHENVDYEKLNLVVRQKSPLPQSALLKNIRYGDNYQSLLCHANHTLKNNPIANIARAVARKYGGDRFEQAMDNKITFATPENDLQIIINKIDKSASAELEYVMLSNIDDLLPIDFTDDKLNSSIQITNVG